MVTSTTITNATNGAIITITTIHHSRFATPRFIILAVLAVILIGSGSYLMFRKEKPR